MINPIINKFKTNISPDFLQKRPNHSLKFLTCLTTKGKTKSGCLSAHQMLNTTQDK